MQDDEFQLQFESCTLPKEYFKHRGHLRITWIYLSRNNLEDAMPQIIQGIKRYAASLGAAHIYHETLTRAWILLVHTAMLQCPSVCYDDFIVINEYLLDKSLIFQYYSTVLLDSENARRIWCEPDLKSL
jgi:hypothetical protein